MTEKKNTMHVRLFVRNALTVLLILVTLFLLSIWSGRKAGEVAGPSRLVKGPHDTVYVRVDRRIATVSSEGDLLSVMSLDTDASVPDASDFFVEEDGRLLIARRDARALEYYSDEGRPLSTLLRMPPTGEDRLWSLAGDTSTGTLYVADASRGLIGMYAPGGKEAGTITVPSGPLSSLPAGGTEVSDLERAYSPRTPLREPHGLTFAGDRLIAADTGNSRIILFFPDGTLDKIVPVFPLESSDFIHPVRADRFGDDLYAVVRSRDFARGEVRSFEFNTGLPRRFRYSGSSDPRDVLVRRDDVLVADRASLTVMRYAHSGRYLGIFGDSGLQSLYAESQFAWKTYDWIGKGSHAGILAVLGWLVFSGAVRLRSLRALHGPSGSARRKALLLIPGLGQAAAGRPQRAVVLLLPVLTLASAFVYSWIRYHSRPGPPLSLLELTTTGFAAFTLWIFVVLDGIRLTEKTSDNDDQPAANRLQRTAVALLITVFSAAAVQLAREFIVQSYPGAPAAIRQLLDLLIASTRGRSSLSGAALSASIVFGWGGAAAAIFGTLAWQAKARRPEIARGIAAGFLAGTYCWLFAAVLTAGLPDRMLYALPLQGALLGLFTWLYFRRQGMPLLALPASAAGAWIGFMLKFFFSAVADPAGRLLSQGDSGGFWIGALARLELILIPAFCIHLAVRAAWTVASAVPREEAAAAECGTEEPAGSAVLFTEKEAAELTDVLTRQIFKTEK